jgi:probable addiction module antidote protein
MTQLNTFDPVTELINDPEAQAGFLAAAFESDDVAHITNALNILARARGISDVAKASGITRAGLYKAISTNGDPRLSTLLGIAKALGFHLSITTAATQTHEPA